MVSNFYGMVAARTCTAVPLGPSILQALTRTC